MDVGGTIGAILNQKGTEIYSIAPDALVFEAIEMMAAKNVGALLVIRGEELLGIISERDYTRKVFLRGKRSRETRVDEIMSTRCDYRESKRAGGKVHASDDGEAHPAFASGR